VNVRQPARPSDLLDLARRAMLEHGLEPNFSQDVADELRAIHGPSRPRGGLLTDLRELLWCSIDNDDSRDLDQLTVAEKLENGRVKIIVAIADVDAVVRRGSAIDMHASANTTSVYTTAAVFPMLPEKLSTNLTSLNAAQDRAALAIEFVVAPDGSIESESVYRAMVTNQAKLAYHGVADWLDGDGPEPQAMAQVHGMDEQIRIQDQIAQLLETRRHEHGALGLETTEVRPVISEGEIIDFEPDQKSRSRELIENFMIVANGVVARYLRGRGLPVFRRIVRTPERWDRIVALAAELGEQLPAVADSAALQQFLARRRKAAPQDFAELSLSIVKLIGSGEYAVERPGEPAQDHFGLAVRDYSHSTAPNRRFPDLITHRMVKAAIVSGPSPYDDAELESLAQHCTRKEDDAKKVERQVRKSAGALVLACRIGDVFDGVVTGVTEGGIWVRVRKPSIEGKIVEGGQGLDVADRVQVRLQSVDVPRGHIDFVRA
jgi:VacB/RNase II family 3'-5' exoribonuclease